MQTGIEAHLPLVRALAGKMRQRGVPFEELCSAGNLGLCKAAAAYDPEKGSFAAYAVPFILGEMRALLRTECGVHLSRQLRERAAAAARAAESLRAHTQREPNLSAIAAEAGLTVQETAEALCAAQPLCSLDGMREHPAETLPASPSPAEEIELRTALSQVLALLSQADRTLLRLRFAAGYTQQQTADALHMTQVQVSRRERRILRLLRTRLTE